MALLRGKSKFKQAGFFWIPAAIAAAAAVASARSASRENRLAQQAAATQAQQSDAFQREFAQHGIQWRVEDAKRAGLHPLYALGASGASYQPAPQQVFADHSTSNMISQLGQVGSRFAQQVGDYYETKAKGDSGSYDQIRTIIEHPSGAASYPVAAPGSSGATSLSSEYNLSSPLAGEFGVVSGQPRKSMARWEIPGVGVVLAPDASNFSESIEGLESLIGQALIVYLNWKTADRLGEFMYREIGKRTANIPSFWDMLQMGAKVVGEKLDKHRR